MAKAKPAYLYHDVLHPDPLHTLKQSVQTDPLVAQQVARRLEVIDAKAASLPPYNDDYEE